MLEQGQDMDLSGRINWPSAANRQWTSGNGLQEEGSRVQC